MLNTQIISKIKPFVFLSVSALLYAFGFVWPIYFWWTPCVWPILLFYVKNPTKFKGFYWGFITYFIQLYPFFVVTYRYGNGNYRLIFPLLLIIYFALQSACWFVFVKKTKRWIFTGLLYFSWMHFCVLWPFGKLEGYPLSFPILPFIGLLQWMPTSQKNVSKFLNSVVCVKPPNELIDASEYREHLCEKLIAAVHCNKKAIIFIMPESSYPKPMTDAFLRMIEANVLEQKRVLIIGSHRMVGDKLYNSALYLYKGRITLTYDKTHLISFFEKLFTPWSFVSSLSNLFLENKEQFIEGNKDSNSILQNKRAMHVFHIPLHTIMCSELFWTERNSKKGLALCLMNDQNFQGTFFPRLMLLYAQYKTIKYSSQTLYCSHMYAYFIDARGMLHSCLSG